MSEKDYARVDIAVHISSSLECSALYAEFKERGWSYKQDMSGPLIKIGEWAGKGVHVAPLIHVIEGVRVMYVEATSELIDWGMINAWIKGVTGKDDIRIQCSPINLMGDISSVIWERESAKVPA